MAHMPVSRSSLAARKTQNAAEDGARASVTVGTLLDRTAFDVSLHTATLSRTLLAAGFSIRRARRQPRHIEIACERADMLGATIPYLLVVCEGNEPPMNDLPNIRRTAARAGQVVVLVARSSGPEWISWPEFLAALGGGGPHLAGPRCGLRRRTALSGDDRVAAGHHRRGLGDLRRGCC